MLVRNTLILAGVAILIAVSNRTTLASTPAGPCNDQKNMAAALASLKSARASLEKAEHNKGGWRVAAITATNTAIAETEKGCAVADK
jgi:hypothetical protein